MITIKGIEIPKRCAKCKFCVNEKTNDHGSFGECLLQENKRVDCLVWSRDENCPIVPLVPLVEVVTCMDCKYWVNGNFGIPYCSLSEYAIDGDGYCSLGKRRA